MCLQVKHEEYLKGEYQSLGLKAVLAEGMAIGTHQSLFTYLLAYSMAVCWQRQLAQ